MPPVATAAMEDARAAGLAAFLTQENPKGAKTLNVSTAFTRPAKVECIPTGALTLDVALGVGGIPKGRLVELYGPESSGKTSLALAIGGNSIAAGGMMGYVDVENAISFEHVRKMGVDLRYFALAQPDSAEEALQMVERMIVSDQFTVIGLDSIAALVPRAELEGDIGDTHVGLTARLMSQALRKLAQLAAKHNVTVIFINQLREKIGVMYGSPEITPGGKAMKFYASIRMDVRSAAGARIKVGTGVNEVIVGQRCTVTIKKNKVAPPFMKAEYNLYFDRGIDASETILKAALKLGVWEARPGGNYFDAATGESVGRGKDAIEAMLASDPELASKVTLQCRAAMENGGVALEDVEATDFDAGVEALLSEASERGETEPALS